MTEKEIVNKQDKVIELLEEILKWTRFQGIQNVKDVLLDALKTNKEKVAYQFSDGRSSAEVSRIAGVTAMTITNYWRRWFTLGIVQPSPKYKGRFERAFSLEDLGIEIPSIEVITKAKVKEPLGLEETAIKGGEPE